jgi:hypothetical protein
MVSIYVNTSISQLSTVIHNVGEWLLFVQIHYDAHPPLRDPEGQAAVGFGGVSSRGQVRRTSSFAVKGLLCERSQL